MSILERIGNDDPVKGRWDVPDEHSGTVWCDASSLATAAVLEIGGRIVEDAAWLRKKDESGHINLSDALSTKKTGNCKGHDHGIRTKSGRTLRAIKTQ